MEKSDITGFGYGSEHNWEDLGKQCYYAVPDEQKHTFYKCRDCGEIFRHYYEVQPEIFEALKNAKVNEVCNKDAKLQKKFMKLIDQMIEVKCKLPKELELYYKIKEEKGQIEVTPYLTKEDALNSCRWYDSDDTSEDEDGTVIYREKVDEVNFKVIQPGEFKVKEKPTSCCGHI